MILLPPERISLPESMDFGRLSGDFNPLHVDPLAARRLPFGGTVVHGVHCLLKAVELWCVLQNKPIRLRSLRAQFKSPVTAGAAFQVGVEDGASKTVLTIHGASGLAQKITLQYEAWDGHTGNPACADCQHSPSEPEQPEFSATPTHSGTVQLTWNEALARTLFPGLRIPTLQASTLLATTRIIGMQYPGLNSLFTGVEVDFGPADPPGNSSTLTYRVSEADDRFRTSVIEFEGAAGRGRLKAMFRAEPVVQESFQALRDLVRPGEFAAQKAIVIGGSRGLGETTAKLIAAGGGSVWVSFARGAADAARVAREITSEGGSAECVEFDVLRPEPPSLPDLPWTHAYYFATPHIQLNKTGVWDDDLFQRLHAYYAAGLERTVRTLTAAHPGTRLTVCYPSTVFLDEVEPGAAEYACAKSSGETLCRYLEQSNSNLRFFITRLPRMRTDQTNPVGFESLAMANTSEVLLGMLRQLSAQSV